MNPSPPLFHAATGHLIAWAEHAFPVLDQETIDLNGYTLEGWQACTVCDGSGWDPCLGCEVRRGTVEHPEYLPPPSPNATAGPAASARRARSSSRVCSVSS